MEGELQLGYYLISRQLLLLLSLNLLLFLSLSLQLHLLLCLPSRCLSHRLVNSHNLSRRIMIHLCDPRRHRGPLLLDGTIDLRGVVDEKGNDEFYIMVAFGIRVGLNHSLCCYMKG